MGISSPGIGSNLDVNSIVTQLLNVDRQPITKLDLKSAGFQAKLSGFGTLKGVLAQFQASLAGLSNASRFQGAKTAIVDPTVATAIGTSAAIPGSYSLEVSKLAQSQKLNATGQVSSTATIGSGTPTTLSFDFGTVAGGTLNPDGKHIGSTFTTNGNGVKTITIDSSNNSLTGIRDAINKASIGITATIVNDGTAAPYRLSLSVGATGVSNSLKVTVAGEANLKALLNHDPAADGSGSTLLADQALKETATAQNAEFKVDGIAVTKTSNTISDAIPGVTLTLAKTNVGAPTTITNARDTANVTSSINSFVKSFNDITQTLRDAAAYNPATRTGAVLNGESSVRTIASQIREVLTAPVAGGASTFTLLSQIGVTVQKDGTLGVDATKLQTAVEKNFDQIAGLFTAVGKTSDALVGYGSSTAKTTSGAFALNISQLATQGMTTAYGAPTSLIIDATNDTLQVNLDGLSSSVSLSRKTYATLNDLAADLQSKINGNTDFSAKGSTATVSVVGGALSVTSASFGTASHAEVTAGNGQTNLRFDKSSPLLKVISGLDVAGTINGKAGTGNGQNLLGAVGDATEGLSLSVTGGAIGDRGTVNFSKGYAYQLGKIVDSLLGADGPIASRTTGINASLKDIAKSKDALNARLVVKEKQYRAQFTALDGVISKMSTTSSFLTQQLANLNKSL